MFGFLHVILEIDSIFIIILRLFTHFIPFFNHLEQLYHNVKKVVVDLLLAFAIPACCKVSKMAK